MEEKIVDFVLVVLCILFKPNLDSFNFVECVSGPTHEDGHTLDLVLSHGLSVCTSEICDNIVSDYMPVLFEVVFSRTAIKSGALAQCRRTFKQLPVGLLLHLASSAFPLT